MGMPKDVGIVDLMIGFSSATSGRRFQFLQPQLRDEESATMATPISYMFKGDANALAEGDDPVRSTLDAMDRFGVAVGMVGLAGEVTERALAEHPDRFVASLEVDPNDITGAVRSVRRAHGSHGIKAVTTFPAGCNPQVPVSDRRYYPLYQVCIDLDIPVVVNAGIAGPRVPSACQDVMHFDQVCYDFPELRIVMRHGAEPWQDLAVKLMLKWPGLYYMTSAFAPKYYPSAVIDYANTRGADKVMYAGYHPFGLTLDRIFAELPAVPLRDHVWPRFLRDNAVSVFKLGA
ncbi:MAG TPA: amidohydrolase family protein [Acidimicrobiales bacterium]|nr:amidohydrolase family protein [Acidimicrobiales bacterium]